MIFMHTVFITGLFLFAKYLFGKTNVEIVKFYDKNKKIPVNQCFPSIFLQENR